MMQRLAFALTVLAIACGPSTPSPSDDDDGTGVVDGGGSTPDAYWGPVGSLSGQVWAPGNALGMVPAGHEIPIFNALVYLSATKPPDIPQQVYCEQCVNPSGSHVFSDHDGYFAIDTIVPGTYWLVIQKGQFRIDQQVVITANNALALTAAQTTLPSDHDPTNGKWVPRIALAAGTYDQMEDIFGKMGLGEVSASGQFVANSAAGNFDVYANGGTIDGVAIEPVENLVMNYEKMRQYHIIFFPCSTQTFAGTGLSGAGQTVWQNLRQYVIDGGKLYVTDWSGEYADNIFPEQIRFAADHDTPASAWNGTTWSSAQFSDSDGSPPYESHHGYAVDTDLHTWLEGQQGPLVDPLGFGTYTAGAVDPNGFAIEGNWDHIEELVDVQVGVDDEGLPVTDRPHAYIIGDQDGSPATCSGGGTGCKPLTVTYQPAGCGRVLYSTYHTAENTHTGLVPQERVLLYLIMEIGVCFDGPIVD